MPGPYDDFWKLLTIVVGIVAVIVATLQYRLARAKLKHDLFEKRYAVFVGTRKFLTVISTKANCGLDDLFEYRAAIGEIEFLFGEELVVYLRHEIDRRAL